MLLHKGPRHVPALHPWQHRVHETLTHRLGKMLEESSGIQVPPRSSEVVQR